MIAKQRIIFRRVKFEKIRIGIKVPKKLKNGAKNKPTKQTDFCTLFHLTLYDRSKHLHNYNK